MSVARRWMSGTRACTYYFVWIAALFAGLAHAQTNGRLQLHFIDVGQGDGALLVSPLGQTVLFDNGVNGNCSKPLEYLRKLKLASIDYHIASHYHSDHIGCTAEVFGSFPLRKAAYDRGGSYDSAAFRAYVAALGAKRTTAVPMATTIALDSASANPVTVTVVASNGNGIATSNENDLSLVAVVSFGDFKAVFGGDLSAFNTSDYKDIETSVAPKVGQVEVYKVHHHCSAYSTNSVWLATTQPKIGIISVGNGNSYGHPTSECLNRLHAAGVKTYWTETGGGAKPSTGLDVVAGNAVIEMAPQATTFGVSYGNTSDRYPVSRTQWANPVPVIASLSPSSATAGSAAFTLTLSGAQFTQASTVLWNATARPTTFVSSGKLLAAISASDVAAPGQQLSVSVVNPAPGGGPSNSFIFSVNNPAPVLASVTPNSVVEGGTGVSLTAAGSNFVSGSVVRWNGADRPTTFQNSGQLQAVINASDVATNGKATVTVFNPPPGGGVSNAASFTIRCRDTAAPVVQFLSPSAVYATTTGQGLTLAVYGSCFTAASVVRWNGADRPTDFVSGDQVRASISAKDIGSAGTAQVTVFNPPPSGILSNAVPFLVSAAPNLPADGVVNAASFTPGNPVAPGSIASVFGTGLALSTASAGGTSLADQLGGVRVIIAGLATHNLFFVSNNQLNIQIPRELVAPGNFSLTVLSGSFVVVTTNFKVAAFAPGIFTTTQSGKGQGAILIAGTGSVAAPMGLVAGARPASRGEYVSIFCTGLGMVNGRVPENGFPAPLGTLLRTVVTPSVTIGGFPAAVDFSGLAPGFVGLYQVNAQIPANAPSGNEVPVVLSIGGVASNTVTIAVQ